MCFRRYLHFSVHDTRSLMTVEPFSLKDDAVFVNPFLVVPHRCDVNLPPPLGELLLVATEGFFGSEVITDCLDHTCCAVRIIDQKCARCTPDIEVFDCQFFTKSHEYIPYESMMDPPEPGTVVTSPATPTWTADIKVFPHQFYPGCPFDKRQDVDGDVLYSFRALLFAFAGDIYTQRRKFALWIEQERNLLNSEVLKTPAGIKHMSASELRWKLDEIHFGVSAAQELMQMATEVSRLAYEMSKEPHSVIKDSCLWEPDPEGPLAEGLDLIVKSWDDLVETWTCLNSAGVKPNA